MHWGTMLVGFVSGAVSGAILLVGTGALLLPKMARVLRREALQDLSHYGRPYGKRGSVVLSKLFHR